MTLLSRKKQILTIFSTLGHLCLASVLKEGVKTQGNNHLVLCILFFLGIVAMVDIQFL